MMNQKDTPKFPWKKAGIALTVVALLHLLFDIPGRLLYWEKEWDIPTDPREKAAYDFAHNIKLPKTVPPGGFKYLKVNERFNKGKLPNTKDNPTIISTTINHFPEPQAFNFVFARFKALFGLDNSVREQYFKHLCDTEAGEYIYKTVKEVDGIYQMRPMNIDMETEETRSRYGFEDPADWHLGEADYSVEEFVNPPHNNFRFFESPREPEQITSWAALKEWEVIAPEDTSQSYFWHYTNFKLPLDGPYASFQRNAKKAVPIDKPTAQYAYTWRGIKRTNDRRYGIAGGEMIVLNWQTKEVLAFRRSFNMGSHIHGTLNDIAWGGRTCPLKTNGHGIERQGFKLNYSYYFINKVFEPLFEKYKEDYFKFTGDQ